MENKSFVRIVKCNCTCTSEVKVVVKGEVKEISDNLKNVLIKDNELTEKYCEKKYIDNSKETYSTKTPKGYYIILASEVGVSNLLSALKELRKLSKEISVIEVNRFQELKLSLLK